MARDVFNAGNLDLLKRSLDAYTLRQRVIAENIAQAETPGYRSRSVNFEDALQTALERGESALPRPVVEDRSPRALQGTDNGVNDVDLDQEMAKLAETNLRHKLATRILSIRYQLLRSAIRGKG
jgi:flagellar basal-body rod protein FlgB